MDLLNIFAIIRRAIAVFLQWKKRPQKNFFMPANLNALIRYKQIDKCLRNRFVDCTIQRMQELCSEALAEYRGVYKLVSERTIRDDLRVMRSEMLGFEAPIVFEDGKYYYSNPGYSIFDIPMEQKDLLKEVFMLLLKERENLKGDEADQLLKRLADMTGEELPPKDMEEREASQLKEEIPRIRGHLSINKQSVNYSMPPGPEKKGILSRALDSLASRKEAETLYWGYVLEIL